MKKTLKRLDNWSSNDRVFSVIFFCSHNVLWWRKKLTSKQDLKPVFLLQVLDEIRPYLIGIGGGELELVQINDYVVKVRLSGPAAGVMTVRVALTQKLREKNTCYCSCSTAWLKENNEEHHFVKLKYQSLPIFLVASVIEILNPYMKIWSFLNWWTSFLEMFTDRKWIGVCAQISYYILT